MCIKLKGQGLADNREYWHDIVGYNYRMTNICAAIGLAQLELIDETLQRKKEIAEYYRKSFEGLPIEFHQEQANVSHSYWMCSILTENGKDREPLREYLKNNGIETRPVFYPIHTMKMYYEESNDLYSVAQNIASRGINLPSYPTIQQNELDHIQQSIIKYFNI